MVVLAENLANTLPMIAEPIEPLWAETWGAESRHRAKRQTSRETRRAMPANANRDSDHPRGNKDVCCC